VKPPHVAAYIELLGTPEPDGQGLSKPSVKQHLAALRMLFDWLVVGHALDVNPAHAVRGPKYSQKKGKTPVLDRDEARASIAAIDTNTLTGLRDRALIGIMIYTFARVGAVLQMNVSDYFSQGRRGWVRLHEKGGKEHEAPGSVRIVRVMQIAIIYSDPGSKVTLCPARIAVANDRSFFPFSKTKVQFAKRTSSSFIEYPRQWTSTFVKTTCRKYQASIYVAPPRSNIESGPCQGPCAIGKPIGSARAA
jgi:hypothetical protein